MLLDVFARFAYQRRLGVLFFERDLVDQCRELLGEECEEPHGRAIFFLWDNRRCLPRLANAAAEWHTTLIQLRGRTFSIRLNGRTAQNLSDAKKTDRFVSESHRHCRFRQPEWASLGPGFRASMSNNLSV